MAANLANDIFECIFMHEKNCILIRIKKFVPKGLINPLRAGTELTRFN